MLKVNDDYSLKINERKFTGTWLNGELIQGNGHSIFDIYSNDIHSSIDKLFRFNITFIKSKSYFISAILSDRQGNIIDIYHYRYSKDMKVDEKELIKELYKEVARILRCTEDDAKTFIQMEANCIVRHDSLKD